MNRGDAAGGGRADLVRKFMGDMSKGDFAVFKSAMADDVVYHLTGSHRFAGAYRGKEMILGLLDGVRSNFGADGLHYEIDRVMEIGDTVVATFKGSGTLANGRAYSNDYCAIWDFDGDRLIKITEFFDSHHVCEVMSADPVA